MLQHYEAFQKKCTSSYIKIYQTSLEFRAGGILKNLVVTWLHVMAKSLGSSDILDFLICICQLRIQALLLTFQMD